MNIKLCREKLETLDSFKIKIIACFCMTVDHVGAFGSDILGSWYYTIFSMMLYNQKKGRNIKGFFYWYYPVHRYVIVIVSAMLGSG